MKLKEKKFVSLLLSFVLVLGFAMPAFAYETPPGTVDSLCSVAGPTFMLNALTWGTPVSGTKVTVWTNDSTNAQRWRMETFPGTSFYWVKNGANASLAVHYNGNAQAFLTTASSTAAATQAIKFIFEGTGIESHAYYGLVLPQYLIALTATELKDGGAVQWQGSNGKTNQLWYRGAYFS